MPRAIVFTCLITGILASIEVYFAQLVGLAERPSPTSPPRTSTSPAAMGGPILLAIVNAALLLANMGSGMASQLGAGRLLYAMGQDGALPRRFFGAVSLKNRIPRNNVILIGTVCLAGALAFNYDLGAELLNYGALLAFIGVNLSSALRGWRFGRWSQLMPILVSLAGAITCALLWWNLSPKAKLVGTCWAIAGILLWLARRRYTVLPGEKPHDTSIRILTILRRVASTSRSSAIPAWISSCTACPTIFPANANCWLAIWPFASAGQAQSPLTISPLWAAKSDSSPRCRVTIRRSSAKPSCTPRGVDLSQLRATAEARTGLTVHLQHAELRHMFTYAGSTFELTFDDLDLNYLADSRHFHMLVVLPAARTHPAHPGALREAQDLQDSRSRSIPTTTRRTHGIAASSTRSDSSTC